MSRLPFIFLIIGLCCFSEQVNSRVRPINKQKLQERLCAVDSRYCKGLVAHDEPKNTTDKTEGDKNELIESNTDLVNKEEQNEVDGNDDEEDEENTNLYEETQEIDEPIGGRRRGRRNRGNNARRRRYNRYKRGRRNRPGRRGGKLRRNRKRNRRNRKNRG